MIPCAPFQTHPSWDSVMRMKVFSRRDEDSVRMKVFSGKDGARLIQDNFSMAFSCSQGWKEGVICFDISADNWELSQQFPLIQM